MTVDLRAIRLAAGLTQPELARKLGLSPRSGRVTVAQIEARQDWLLSSLSAYLRASGATAELVVKVWQPADDGSNRADLTEEFSFRIT